MINYKKNIRLIFFDINLIEKINFSILLLFPVLLILGKSLLNLAVIILVLSCTILIIKKKINFFHNVENILFFIFFLYVSLNALFNFTSFENFLKSIGLFRYIFFSIVIAYTLSNITEYKFKIIKIFYSTIILFVILDIILQYFVGFDVFGFKPGMCENGNCLRYQGPFGEKLIAGSFLTYFGLTVSLFLFKEKNLNLLLLIFGLVIIITGDRSPFITYLIFFFIYLVVSKQKIKKKIFTLFLFFTIFFILINYSSSLKVRYIEFLKKVSNSEKGKIDYSFNYSNVFDNIKNSPWGKHYQVAWAMFLDKPIIGHGYNSFPTKCRDYERITNTDVGLHPGCSTHPHNAFLEILAEQGLVGFFILNVIIIYILKKIFHHKFINKNIKIKFILSGILFLAFFFPLKPTGSLFTTWLGTLTFFVYSFYLFFLGKDKSIN